MARTEPITVPVTADIEMKTAVDSIIEAARAGQPVGNLDLGQVYARQRADGGVDVVDLTTEQHMQALDRLARRFMDAPRRKIGRVALTEPGSFIGYVTKHYLEDATELYGDRKAGTITAVLNSDGVDEAGWGDHRAILTLTPTDAWKAWTQASGQLVNQTEFAEFLEDRAPDVVEPDAATLIEIATTMQASTAVAWKSGVRLQDGTVQLGYEETSDATAGTRGHLAIPQTITLGIAPFEGLDPYRVTARLRYRMRDGRLTIGVVLDQADDVLKAAFGDIVDTVEVETDHSVWHGRFER